MCIAPCYCILPFFFFFFFFGETFHFLVSLEHEVEKLAVSLATKEKNNMHFLICS